LVGLPKDPLVAFYLVFFLGSDPLDGPLNALVLITNTLSEPGVGLNAGQFVTTGVTVEPTPIKQGDLICADLRKYGAVSASLI